MAETRMTDNCSCCKGGSRSLWEFAHHHLEVMDTRSTEDVCMICLEGFGDDENDDDDGLKTGSGEKDVPVRVTGIEGCRHVYGLACLQRMWAFSATKGGIAKSVKSVCMLDKRKWFSSLSVLMPRYPEAVKRAVTKMLAREYGVDAGTARFFLFREEEWEAGAQVAGLEAVRRRFEMEQCIKWAVEVSEPVRQVVRLVQVQQQMSLDAGTWKSSIRKVRKHFGFKSNHWDVSWRGLMDPFTWSDFMLIDTCHQVRLATAVYQTEKGQTIYKYAREAVKRRRSDLGDTPSVVRCALSIAELVQEPALSEIAPAVEFLAAVLLTAELQRTRGVELAVLPGMAGSAWQYMSWVESFTFAQRLQYLDIGELGRTGGVRFRG